MFFGCPSGRHRPPNLGEQPVSIADDSLTDHSSATPLSVYRFAHPVDACVGTSSPRMLLVPSGRVNGWALSDPFRARRGTAPLRKQNAFRPNGLDDLEVRIAPSTPACAPAAQIVQIDAHVQHAKAHSHTKVHHKVHHKVHSKVHPTSPHVYHPVSGPVGSGSTGSGSTGNGTILPGSGSGGILGGGDSGGGSTGGGSTGGGPRRRLLLIDISRLSYERGIVGLPTPPAKAPGWLGPAA